MSVSSFGRRLAFKSIDFHPLEYKFYSIMSFPNSSCKYIVRDKIRKWLETN